MSKSIKERIFLSMTREQKVKAALIEMAKRKILNSKGQEPTSKEQKKP